MFNSSIIISHKSRSPERLRNLKIVVKWLGDIFTKEDQVELIIVEQGGKKTLCLEDLPEVPFPIKCKFVHKEGLFNKSWGYNIGANMARYENLLFIDNDIILTREAVDEGFKVFKHVDGVRFYDRLYALSEEETMAIENRLEYPPKTKRILRDFSVPGGFFLIRKDLFFKLGGWDEEFEGWGGEDDAFYHKLSRHSIVAVTIPAYHLSHPSFGVYDDPKQFEVVKEVYKKIKSLSHEEILEKSKKTILGAEDKYLIQNNIRHTNKA
ncbi:MAG: galactosyltransferase-related protein [Patescibacteria group bacterium]